MIRLRGVRKNYITNKVVNEVLKGVDLDIEEGEFVAIVGRSGSGKTTLLNIVGALDSHYEGTVEVDGRRLDTLNDTQISDYRNRNIGFIFQGFHLLEHLTCIENITLPAMFSRGKNALDTEQAMARAKSVLAEVELSEKADALPNTLSGGQKQRIAIARALFNQPRLMICDEPTGNLDTTTAHAILELFRKLNRDQGITLVIVTHDEMISDACERVVHIEDGRMLDGAGEHGAQVAAPDSESDPDPDPEPDPDPGPSSGSKDLEEAAS